METTEKRISLLQDLVGCLDKERESLLEINVTELWAVMEEKQAILEAIEELPAVPAEKSSTPPSIRSEINRLKEEIRNRARENTEFTRSSLAVFDEIISRITGTGKDDQTYRPPGEEHRAQRSPLYHREV